MGVTSEGLSYAETQMKNYRHLASLGSPRQQQRRLAVALI
jgi:hypothetical protein